MSKINAKRRQLQLISQVLGKKKPNWVFQSFYI